ncbi:hypothetical protein S40288_05113 [Stachybotrys chartarum IBT 40288]|nr:hypothetical protein S40288_05113 [Stachybotrys chartarum IBT 40288]
MEGEKKLCQNCQLLAFDTDKAVEATAPTRDPIEGYAVVPLRYLFEDDFPRLPRLRNSIEEGCEMCRFLKDVVWSHIRIGLDVREVASRAIARDRESDGALPNLILVLELNVYHPFLPTVKFTETRKDWLPGRIDGNITLGSLTTAISIHVNPEPRSFRPSFPSTDPLSEESLEVVQGYISSCLSPKSGDHEYCPKSQDNVAPLRLLKVCGRDMVRLVYSEGTRVRYAILSYCWGSSAAIQASKTVESNLKSRMAGFAVTDLPRTLQDSVVLIRKLGISHVWIDALCIVQDSSEWDSESLRMMQYYENAYLTIVPLPCDSADQSFLGRRPWWVTRLIDWPGPLVAKPPRLQFFFPAYTGPQLEIEKSAWGTRGWTFQEQFLSARCLFVGSHGMMFQCRAGSVCEPDEFHLDAKTSDRFLPIQTKGVLESSEWNTIDMVRSKWFLLIGKYAGRKLTYESDRLTAISGVASKFRRLFGDQNTYIDGFWRDELCNQLLWRPLPLASHRNGIVVKNAEFPSWSWCSSNVELIWSDATGVLSCADFEQRAEATATDPGNSACGHARRADVLVVATWIFEARNLLQELPGGIEIDTDIDTGTDLEGALKHGRALAVVLTAYHDGDDPSSWRTFPVAKPHDISGLIVEETESLAGTHAMYRRIGMFNIARKTRGVCVWSGDSTDSDDEGPYYDIVPVEMEEGSLEEVLSFYRMIYANRRTIYLI